MNASATAKRDSTAAGTKEHAAALVELEVYRELAKAVNVSV